MFGKGDCFHTYGENAGCVNWCRRKFAAVVAEVISVLMNCSGCSLSTDTDTYARFPGFVSRGTKAAVSQPPRS